MSTPKKRAPRLGKGLSSLMAQPVAVHPPTLDVTSGTNQAVDSVKHAPSTVSATLEEPESGLLYVPVDHISPNPHQPRQRIEKGALHRLAESIRQDGLMQPVIVRPAGDRYELVAGERRWRAAQVVGLDAIPAIVRDLDDQQLAEWALIENLQREDLNPIERAMAFHGLIKQFGVRHEQIAERLGLDRSTVSNSLRLLDLDKDVRALVRDELLSMGQARALGGLSDPLQQRALAERAVREAWSVRQVEQAVRTANASGGVVVSTSSRRRKPAHVIDLEKQITQQLQTKVRIRPGRKKGSGSLTIDYFSVEDFDALMKRLGVEVE